MKLLCVFICLLTFHSLSAQDDAPGTPQKTIPSSARLTLANGTIARGWLYDLNDSQVVLLPASAKQLKRLKGSTKEEWNSLISTYPVNGIMTISVKRKNAVLKDALIGLGIGAVAGAVIGFADGDDPVMSYSSSASDPLGLNAFAVAINNAFAMTAGEKAVFGGVALGFSGALAGAVIGAVAKKKFIIGGKKERYRDLEGDLRRRLIVR